MKKRNSFLLGSIVLWGMSAFSKFYVQPDAPIKEVCGPAPRE